MSQQDPYQYPDDETLARMPEEERIQVMRRVWKEIQAKREAWLNLQAVSSYAERYRDALGPEPDLF